jgi:hypothetical protein
MITCWFCAREFDAEICGLACPHCWNGFSIDLLLLREVIRSNRDPLGVPVV